MFHDRTDAGKKLAARLEGRLQGDAIVLALPRGGVVTGAQIAEALHLPLDIISVRKIGHPTQPEFAIGAVDERGETLMNEDAVAAISPGWVREEIRAQADEAKRRSLVYRSGRHPVAIRDKTVIIADDGIATGLTMRLAVRRARSEGAKQVIVAVPVAPADTAEALKAEGADEIITLLPPADFLGAVGAHYVAFSQVEDGEVTKILSEHCSRQ